MRQKRNYWNPGIYGLLLLGVSLWGCQPSRSEYHRSQLQHANNATNKNSAAQALSSAAQSHSSSIHANSSSWYQVTKVSDGDTFWCMDERENKIKIRLIGIDSPEPRNYFRKKKQPFGKEASHYAQQLLLHKKVRLAFDVDSLDQFGRTLAYAYLEDGTFVNKKIVEDGYAILMTIVPNVKYEEVFWQAQQQARKNALGLWQKP